MSNVASIVDVLQGKVAIGETVTVRGWVRYPSVILKQAYLS